MKVDVRTRFVNAIYEGIAWVALEADEEPAYQTRRFPRYREVA
jgi:glutamyl/glutaminyl-tRNA synthetase